MNGDYSIFNNSMNGVITLSDGVSIITDGQAQHENIIYSNFIKSENSETVLTTNTLTTGTIDASNLTVTTINADAETVGVLNCTTLNVDNYGFYVDGFGNTISTSLPTTMNNTLKVVANEFTLENGNINQIGTTAVNNLKTTSINGSLTCQSDIIQQGGNSVLKNVTCDNLTMNSNKSISQSGAGVSNSLGTTTISNLVVTSAMSFPSTITIPEASQTGDLTFTGGARIIQDLTEAGTNYNTLMYSKIAKVEANGDVVQTSGTATLQNTVIQGTAQIQGDITQTSGQSVFKAIGCDQLTLTANKDIFFSNGTGKIDQSLSSGTNTLNAITMNANRNLTQSGTGILSQSGTGTNALKNTSITGTLAVSSSTTLSGNVQCDGTLTMGANRSIQQPAGTTNNQFQTSTISNLTCPVATITDITATTLAVGNVSNTEIQYLDGVIAPIQDQLNSISTTSAGNSTALTGITYTAGDDTTTIDNNVSITKTLALSTVADVATSITGLNSSVATLDASLNTLTNNFNTVTSGMSYNSGTDTTTLDNNVTITKNLIVQGMNLKAEIDALETSFTTGTLNSTTATIANLTSTNITTTNLTASNQVRCPNFSISNNGAAATTYNATAITNPVQTHGLGVGTGDGATYTTFNQGIFSWYGTAFVDSVFKICHLVVDHRTGNLFTNGIITCASLVVNSLTTLAKVIATSSYVDEFFTASNNEFSVYPNKVATSTEGVKTLGLNNVVVASLTLQQKYNETITITSPISLYRRFRNVTASAGTYTTLYDRVLQVNCNIFRNNVAFTSLPCVCNNTIPQPSLMTFRADTSLTEKWFDIYITNATVTFTPSITETTDTYRIEYIITSASGVADPDNFVSLDYGFYVNANSSTFNKSSGDIILQTGAGGTNYVAYSRTTAFKNDYVVNGSSRMYANNLATNNILNQGSMSTNSLVVSTSIQTNSLSINAPLTAQPNKPITSPATYVGVWMVNAAVNDYKLDKFNAVLASVAVAGERDDYWIICAGYKVVLYRYSNYAILSGFRPWSGSTDWDSQTRTIDNTNGTNFISLSSSSIYGTFNQVGSCKVYYQNEEVTIPFLS